MALACISFSFEISEPTIHLIIASYDFAVCIRHSAVLHLTLDLDVVLVLS